MTLSIVRWLISNFQLERHSPANIHGVWYSDVSHLAYFEVSTPSLNLYNHKLRTLRYRNVMRDQRCLCPELDVLVCSCPFVV